jgi:hypothetical protein
VTLLPLMDAVAAMCMRLILGCGSLDVAIRVWEVCHVRRLLSGRMLLCKSGTSAELRLAGVAMLIEPDWK